MVKDWRNFQHARRFVHVFHFELTRFAISVPPFFNAEANMPMLIEMIDRKAGIA